MQISINLSFKGIMKILAIIIFITSLVINIACIYKLYKENTFNKKIREDIGWLYETSENNSQYLNNLDNDIKNLKITLKGGKHLLKKEPLQRKLPSIYY